MKRITEKIPFDLQYVTDILYNTTRHSNDIVFISGKELKKKANINITKTNKDYTTFGTIKKI